MTDWETTKIKKPVKEKAAEDPRTYTEIMEAGLDTSSNTHTSNGVNIDAMLEADKEDMNEIKEQLDRIESAQATTVSDSLGIAENDLARIVEVQEETIEELEQQRDMLNQIVQMSVNLDASERAKIARDVAEELR